MPITIENEHGHQIFPKKWRWWHTGIVRVTEWLESFLPEAPGYDCLECGEYGHGWMTQDYIWEKIVHAYNASDARTAEQPHDVDDPYLILCLDCAQKHLGRDFEATDFTEVPINKSLMFGYVLGSDKQIRAEGEDPETYDNYVPLFLWSFMLEQLTFIRASDYEPDERQGRWRIVHDYLLSMLEKGPFHDALRSFGDTAHETAHEIGNTADEFTWRRFLKNALDTNRKKESST